MDGLPMILQSEKDSLSHQSCIAIKNYLRKTQ